MVDSPDSFYTKAANGGYAVWETLRRGFRLGRRGGGRLGAWWLTALSLLAMALAVTPRGHGDAGEYQLMGESLIRHASPEVRPADVESLAERSRRQFADVSMAAALAGYFEARDGSYYSYHFWGYALATLPARALLRPFRQDLKAAQVTNAILVVLALHQVLLASGFRRSVAWGLFGLALFSPAVWFVLWTHPEASCAGLVLLALAFEQKRRPLGAVVVASLAAAQNPPLVWLVAALWLRLAWTSVPSGSTRYARAAWGVVAALPAIVPALFYWLKFGTPSVIAREATNMGHLSLARAAGLLFDLNLGLWPYMPLTVPLFLAALAVPRGAWLRWRNACVFGLAALSCTVTGNWNHGTAGPSRYAVWLSPLIVWTVASAHNALTGRARRMAPLAVGLAVLAQAAVVFSRGGLSQPQDELSHSWAARSVFRLAPRLYSPPPEVFISRTLGVLNLTGQVPAVYVDDRGCRKAWVRPKDGGWLREQCGSLPAGEGEFFTRTTGRRVWTYVSW